MTRVLTVTFYILFYFGNANASTPNSSNVNKQQIITLTNDYILLLQEAINQRSGGYLSTISDCFNNYTENDHVYDLNDNIEKMMVGAYLSDAKNNLQITEFDALTEEMEILPCTYFNPKTSKNYTYVKLPKIMVRQGDNKQSYNHYLSIDVTTEKYFIDAIYKDDTTTAQKFIAPCMQKQLDAEKQRQLALVIEAKYEEVITLYGETKYLDALVIIEEILDLNKVHQESLDAKDAVLDLISTATISNRINSALNNRELSNAKNTLDLVEQYGLAISEEIILWRNTINDKEIEIKLQDDFDRAEDYFSKKMYQKALEIYVNLKESNFLDNSIDLKIKTCKEADPKYVQNKIKEAYNAAVKSKKNADATFKTYYKFQNSGYLEGSNYRFMCQMMLSKGNKKLLVDMNIPTSQAKNLAIKYFFKASENGKDMRDIEYMIFTENFNKN